MNKNFFVTSFRIKIKQLPIAIGMRRTADSYRHQRSEQNSAVIPTIGGIYSSFVQKLGRCLLRRHDIQLSFAILIVLLFNTTQTNAQLLKNKPTFTKADTLRGSLNENRDWWDVLRYDITVKPDYEKKEIEGKCFIQFNAMQLYTSR